MRPGEAMRAGAARAIVDVLRARRPDLAFEIGVSGKRDKLVSPGSEAGGGKTDTILDRPAALADVDDAERAA
jgi:hypothetical protein